MKTGVPVRSQGSLAAGIPWPRGPKPRWCSSLAQCAECPVISKRSSTQKRVGRLQSGPHARSGPWRMGIGSWSPGRKRESPPRWRNSRPAVYQGFLRGLFVMPRVGCRAVMPGRYPVPPGPQSSRPNPGRRCSGMVAAALGHSFRPWSGRQDPAGQPRFVRWQGGQPVCTGIRGTVRSDHQWRQPVRLLHSESVLPTARNRRNSPPCSTDSDAALTGNVSPSV